MTDRRTAIKLGVVAAIVLLMLGLVVAVFAMRGASGGGSSDGPNFIVFVPIWFAAMVPILAAKSERKRQAAEKGKRKRKPQNRRELMTRLVDDMDDDERAYLLRRLADVYGPEERSDLDSR